MEDKKVDAAQNHKAQLNNRRSANFTGVTDVVSFDTSEILLETQSGMLNIRGNDMHVSRLSLEKGEVDMEGRIDSLIYSDAKGASKGTESIFGKLFG